MQQAVINEQDILNEKGATYIGNKELSPQKRLTKKQHLIIRRQIYKKMNNAVQCSLEWYRNKICNSFNVRHILCV